LKNKTSFLILCFALLVTVSICSVHADPSVVDQYTANGYVYTVWDNGTTTSVPVGYATQTFSVTFCITNETIPLQNVHILLSSLSGYTDQFGNVTFLLSINGTVGFQIFYQGMKILDSTLNVTQPFTYVPIDFSTINQPKTPLPDLTMANAALVIFAVLAATIILVYADKRRK
jgi:hypothetical protein